ncbi:hypothetical protein WKI65_36695 [Streptomyces sp. MS1.AVA.3]|uniref:hypothetical protein n=1 Tax=Streptomyces decoyicus TaxID=249567 RepID=UPI0030C4A2BF
MATTMAATPRTGTHFDSFDSFDSFDGISHGTAPPRDHVAGTPGLMKRRDWL